MLMVRLNWLWRAVMVLPWLLSSGLPLQSLGFEMRSVALAVGLVSVGSMQITAGVMPAKTSVWGGRWSLGFASLLKMASGKSDGTIGEAAVWSSPMLYTPSPFTSWKAYVNM